MVKYLMLNKECGATYMKCFRNITSLSMITLALLTVISLTVSFASSIEEETVVYVQPPETAVNVGKEFEVYINVRNVSGLQGFDFRLSYETELLDCLSVEEGDFLSASGPTFVCKKDIFEGFSGVQGYVWFAVVIYGLGFADGEGTLAVITFKATAIGETVLDIYSDPPYKADKIKLTTCGAVAIPNEALDGYVTISNSEDPPRSPDPPEEPPSNPNLPNPDVNGDGIINILDLAIIAKAYGSRSGDIEYEDVTDLDQNGVVNIQDVAIAALEYGQEV